MNTTVTGASISFTRSLFARGTDLLDSPEIKQVFGLGVASEGVPFTEQDLALARQRDEMLVYYPAGITMKNIHKMRDNKTSDGRKLFYDIDWYKEESFFTNDTLRPGWRLVSRAVLDGSCNQNYVEQTAMLCEHLVSKVFVESAVAEFRKVEKELAELLSKDWQEAAKRLVALKVNQMFRETPAEVLWSLSLYEGTNHERLLPSGSWTWTNKLSSRGNVVDVGDFDGFGVRVRRGDPRDRNDDLGFRFSRSGNLE
jgi:hypothetical protein